MTQISSSKLPDDHVNRPSPRLNLHELESHQQWRPLAQVMNHQQQLVLFQFVLKNNDNFPWELFFQLILNFNEGKILYRLNTERWIDSQQR